MNADFRDILRELVDAGARFMVVGAYAVGVHGRPRATKDLDIWVDASAENAPRVMQALLSFGAPLMGLTEEELHEPGKALQIGVPPGRIDILTQISGLAFAEAWPNRTEARFGDVSCSVIGLTDLLTNKRASARPQDLADVTHLERLRRLRAKT